MRLIDTPGYCGSGMNHTACSNVLESSTAFVFAIPYTQLGDTRDVAILDEIMKVDPCKSWYCIKTGVSLQVLPEVDFDDFVDSLAETKYQKEGSKFL